MSPPNCHLSKIDVGTKTNMKILSDIKGQVLAIALLLLIVAHGSDARADCLPSAPLGQIELIA